MGVPAEEKLLGVTGGGASAIREETGTPHQPLPVENTGAALKNESSDGETTELQNGEG